jgi:hypothetical protein
MYSYAFVPHDCSSNYGQRTYDCEIYQGGGLVFSQENQNTRSLVIGQAFFNVLLRLKNTACLPGNVYTAFSSNL